MIILCVCTTGAGGIPVPAQLPGSALGRNKKPLTQRYFEETLKMQSLIWQFKTRLRQQRTIHHWLCIFLRFNVSQALDFIFQWGCCYLNLPKNQSLMSQRGHSKRWRGCGAAAFGVITGFNNKKNRTWHIFVSILRVWCEHNLQST